MKIKKILVFIASLVLIAGFVWYAVLQEIETYGEMPTMVIEVVDDEEFVNKDYLDATITIDYLDQMQDATFRVSIRQRGNSTLGFPKKPYKIKLEEKADLLLDGSTVSDQAARDWVLLADYYDRSNLRNYYAFAVAGQLDSFLFVPEGVFTELYFQEADGTLVYQGVYLLCDQVEVDETRIDIDETAETEKGFLIEFSRESRAVADASVEIDNLFGMMYFNIGSAFDGDEDIERVQDVVQAADDAIASGDKEAIEAVLDLDSCVDMYILQEFMKNIDVGTGSLYLYCEAVEEVLHFVAPWDFDYSSGMHAWLDDGGHEGLYAGDAERSQNQWYRMLMQYEWFQDLVRERWNATKEAYLISLDEIESVANRYDAQLQENYNLWRTETQNTDQMAYVGDSYQDDAQYLFDWIENRYLWLDDYFNNVI